MQKYGVKTNEQESEFIKSLIKMDKFQIFPPQRSSNIAIQATSSQRYAW